MLIIVLVSVAIAFLIIKFAPEEFLDLFRLDDEEDDM